MRIAALHLLWTVSLPYNFVAAFRIAERNDQNTEDDSDPFLVAIQNGPPKPKTIPEELIKEEVKKMQPFADILPFRPRGMPYENFKERCMGFVQGVIKKAGYSPERLPHVMPHCNWGNPDVCKELQAKLVDVIRTVGLRGGKEGVGGSSPADIGSSSSSSGSSSSNMGDDTGSSVVSSSDEYKESEESAEEPKAALINKFLKHNQPTSVMASSTSAQEAVKAAIETDADQGRLEEPIGSTSPGSEKGKEPVKSVGAHIYGWCDEVYLRIKDKKMGEKVKERLVEEASEAEEKKKLAGSGNAPVASDVGNSFPTSGVQEQQSGGRGVADVLNQSGGSGADV